MNNNENSNKNVIIIGASSGIGLRAAELLLSKGYKVTNISRSLPYAGSDVEENPKKSKLNPKKLTQKVINGSMQTVFADAAKKGELAKAIALAADDKLVDALVYSAGCSMASPIEIADSKDYRYLFEVNFFGILESIKAVVPFMKKNGGRIILISSLAATFPIMFDAFYSCSKAAVDMLAESADLELKPYGIRVVSVRPGGVKTDFTFKRNIYGVAAVKDYAFRQLKAVEALAETEQNGLDAGCVADTVFTVLTMPNPPVKVAVGLKNKAFCAAARILPNRVVSFLNSVKYE